MSDLVSMQPNIKIDLFTVAPYKRRETIASETNRSTFAHLKPPLPRICHLLSVPKLQRGDGADLEAQFAT